MRIQELIWRLQPGLIIETGVAHGGSLIFYASLFEAMRKGRVIGIDVEIRAHNRAAIEAHPLAARITLIEGNSVAPSIVEALRAQVRRGETVLVVLDSNHSLEHVAAELSAYSPMVSAGSYVVACDGIMKQVAGAPRTAPDWTWNNPLSAVDNFLAGTSEFVREEPPFAFNEGRVRDRVTYWPKCFLKRIAGGEK